MILVLSACIILVIIAVSLIGRGRDVSTVSLGTPAVQDKHNFGDRKADIDWSKYPGNIKSKFVGTRTRGNIDADDLMIARTKKYPDRELKNQAGLSERIKLLRPWFMEGINTRGSWLNPE